VTPASARVHLARGSVAVLAAESAALPVAFLLAAFLTRRLGPASYGVYALAASLVGWVEWTAGSMLNRAIIREASGRHRDGALGSAALQINLAIGLLALVIVWIAAPMVASIAGEPALATALRLLAADIPIFAATMAHRGLLVADGAYSSRALLPAARWIGRLTLVVLFVEAGLGVEGALAGCIAASLVELVFARVQIRPPLLAWTVRAWPRLLRDAPFFLLLGVTLRLFDRIDLLMFKVLGGSTAEAGIYGAAHGAASSLTLVSIAFPPLLLATLTRSLESGDSAESAALTTRSLRTVCCLIPLVGVAYAVGTPAATWLFGPLFSGAGPLLAPMVATAVGQVVISVSLMTLTATGRPNTLIVPAIVMLSAALVGGALVIPRYGAMGATSVTCAISLAGAAFAVGQLKWAMGIAAPFPTILRATAAAIVAAFASNVALRVLPLPAAVLVGLGAAFAVLQLTGELRAEEMRRFVESETSVSANALGEVG
jgi:O-antigen/teichoic acid export membrane protein